MREPTRRFSDRVEDYVKFRPSYPAPLLDLLQRRCGLCGDSVVADIGSGTGILSTLLLQADCRVFGVEPNAEMRRAAEHLLVDQPRFVSVDGTAENTTLPVQSMDLVAAGQAFHWFDRDRARREFLRIARPRAWAVIVWNTRLTFETTFLTAYEELLRRFAPEYAEVDHRNITDEALTEFFAPSPVECVRFRNSQTFDFAGLAGRLMSSSYAPKEHEPSHGAMMSELRRVFEENQSGGKVEFLYHTVTYYGRLQSKYE